MRHGVGVLALVLVLVSWNAAAAQRSEFLYLDEVRAGMTGIGKTIVAGDKISEFSVEVLGVIDEPGTLSDFLVVRVSGEAIGRSGGIAQGMSGSPIYIDGKLVGALSRAASWSKEIVPIGLVTPIEPMLEVLDAAKTAAAPDPQSVLAGVRVVECASAPDAAMMAAAPDTVFAYPVSSPLVVAGLSERARTVLMSGAGAAARPRGLLVDVLPPHALGPHLDGLSAFALSVLPASAGSTGGAWVAEGPAPVPGGALGVALATGDITIGALGTVTYVDGDGVIGFGHPFLLNGASSFPLTTVSILDTIKALDASFKLGTIGAPIGVIREDRTAAIGGTLGGTAATVGVEFLVEDLQEGGRRTLSTRLVDEPRLLPELLLASGLEAIDSVLDRIGPGTVEVTYRIAGDGMPSTLERRDVFLSTQDVAVYPVWQLADIVAYLEYNEFADPELTDVSASMRVTRDLRAVRIEDLTLDQLVYEPGDEIVFTLVLQTYQAERIVRRGTLWIPDDLLADEIVVRAYGGPRPLERGEKAQTFESLADVIELIESLPSYEQVTVELFAVDAYRSGGGEALYGVGEITDEFPGHVVYDEREARAILFPAMGDAP